MENEDIVLKKLTKVRIPDENIGIFCEQGLATVEFEYQYNKIPYEEAIQRVEINLRQNYDENSVSKIIDFIKKEKL